jgi:bacterioferritin-associated ferredoxin
MATPVKKDKSQRLICLCNSIPQSEIEAAIRRGCKTLGRIFDATTAGVGACGGSCQPILRRMLDSYLTNGKFEEDPRPPQRKPGTIKR